MTTFNPEASSFDPVLIAPPTAFDIAYMRKTCRLRAASDPGPLPEDEVNRLELPVNSEDMPQLSPTSFFLDLETPEPSESPNRMLNYVQEDGKFLTDPVRTPLIRPEPEQMYDEVCDPMFYYPEPFCLPLPALPMEPINEVISESQPFFSNTMFGYDTNTPFPVPGPTHFIMERMFEKMYVDDTTYPGFTVLTDDGEQEQHEDNEYVIFGLNDPSEHTDFGRAMAAKHSVPRLNSVYNFQECPAFLGGAEWDLEAQQ